MMYLSRLHNPEVSVGKTVGENDTVYRIDTVPGSGYGVVEFRQDPVDPSTFRRYIDGERR